MFLLCVPAAIPAAFWLQVHVRPALTPMPLNVPSTTRPTRLCASWATLLLTQQQAPPEPAHFVLSSADNVILLALETVTQDSAWEDQSSCLALLTVPFASTDVWLAATRTPTTALTAATDATPVVAIAWSARPDALPAYPQPTARTAILDTGWWAPPVMPSLITASALTPTPVSALAASRPTSWLLTQRAVRLTWVVTAPLVKVAQIAISFSVQSATLAMWGQIVLPARQLIARYAWAARTGSTWTAVITVWLVLQTVIPATLQVSAPRLAADTSSNCWTREIIVEKLHSASLPAPPALILKTSALAA